MFLFFDAPSPLTIINLSLILDYLLLCYSKLINCKNRTEVGHIISYFFALLMTVAFVFLYFIENKNVYKLFNL